MGQCSPHEHLSAACLGITIAWGITATCGGASVFTVGAGVGGIGQTFLTSNKFSEADPALGQGVASFTGAWGTSSGGGGWGFELKDFLWFGVFLLGKEFH